MKVYFDHAATTPTDKRVFEKMIPFFCEEYGNANSLHSFGRFCDKAVSIARNQVSAALNCKPNEIYFTASGSEANNWAIKGYAFAHKDKGKHIITSKIEHPSVLNTCLWLEKQGFEVTYLDADELGRVDVNQLKKEIRPTTILISVMYANNEVGTIQPLKEISAIAKRHSIALHSDCVQAVGSIPVDVADLGADLVSISAHKFYGPKGVGALYIKNGVKIDKLIAGGGQERAQRGGTTNTPAIVGMGEAISLAVGELESNSAYVAKLRDSLVEKILKSIPYCYYNGDRINRLPNNANFSFEFIEGEGILMLLDIGGVAVSSGSACSSATLEPSHVLLAIGVDIVLAHGSVRFSLGKHNTMEEVDYVVKVLSDSISKLRAMSPLFALKEGGTQNV